MLLPLPDLACQRKAAPRCKVEIDVTEDGQRALRRIVILADASERQNHSIFHSNNTDPHRMTWRAAEAMVHLGVAT